MLQETATRPETTARATGDAAEWRRLRQDVRQATQDGGFTLVFQPRRSLADASITGAAAQLRWPRRRGGVMQASGLATVLESCGLTANVAAWTLIEACRAAAAWPRGQVSVSAAGLGGGRLLRQIGAALKESGLAAGRLEIGLTEAALAIDTPEVLLSLAALRDRGVRVALEGFGGESANLMPLKRLPLTTLILDRSLVRDLPDDAEAAAIMHATISLAGTLGIAVIANGVETQPQRDWLRRAGCEAAQGSFCGRSLSASALAEAMAKEEEFFFEKTNQKTFISLGSAGLSQLARR